MATLECSYRGRRVLAENVAKTGASEESLQNALTIVVARDISSF